MDKKKQIRSWMILLASAMLFFVVTMPFRQFFRVAAVTEVRPAAALNPLLGLLYGMPGALGCALGNLAADALSGYSPVMCFLGFIVQMFYGLFPYVLWKRFGGEVRLNTSRNVSGFFALMLADSALTSFFLSAELYFLGLGSIWSMTTLMFFFNDFVFCMVFGIPLLLLDTGIRMRKNGGRFSLNEQFIVLFLVLAILSACLIGLIAYRELSGSVSDIMDLWNRVYIYISVDLLIFCVVIVGFLRYGERNITFPMERLAAIAREYIQTEEDGRLDLQSIIRRCGEFDGVRGEAGALASAFRDMTVNMEQYLENLTKMTAEKERISAELDVATQIQANALPNVFPAFPERTEFSIYASMTPAKEVGGDFYDFFLVDGRRLGVVIADVSGKGVPAALFMMTAKTLIKNFVLDGKSPARALELTNTQLCEGNEAGMFVTVWAGVLDYGQGTLTFANAGHNPPLLKQGSGDFLYMDHKRYRRGMMLGLREGIRYTDNQISLQGEDILYLYTDGVTEANNISQELYGEERLMTCMRQQTRASVREIVEAVHRDIYAFVGEAEQFDDITMVAVRTDGVWRRCETEAVYENTARLSSFLEERIPADWPSKSKHQLLMALDEIVSNIIKYSGASLVTLQLGIFSNIMYLEFSDDGMAFNPLEQKAPDVAAPKEERQIGGLGLFLVQKMMDGVEYARTDGKNRLTVWKENKKNGDHKKCD